MRKNVNIFDLNDLPSIAWTVWMVEKVQLKMKMVASVEHYVYVYKRQEGDDGEPWKGEQAGDDPDEESDLGKTTI